jgi:uncharacterized protein DUF222/HNH endonuclease
VSRSGPDSPPAPACLAEALALIETGLDYINSEDVPGLPIATQAEALREWSRLDAKRTAAEAALVNAFDAAEGYAADGQSSTSSWLTFFTHCTATAARQTVAGARRLRDHPHVARALVSGRIPASVARLLIDFCGRLPADDQEAAERVLTDVAVAGADTADLSLLASEIYRRVYPNGVERDEERRAADRGLTLGKTFGGAGRLNADLTAHATGLAEQVIGALAKRRGPEDTRTARQRRHDAFVEALSLLVGSKLMPERGGAKPQVKVDIPLAALRRLPGADDAVNEWIRLKAGQLSVDPNLDPIASDSAGSLPVVAALPDALSMESLSAESAAAEFVTDESLSAGAVSAGFVSADSVSAKSAKSASAGSVAAGRGDAGSGIARERVSHGDDPDGPAAAGSAASEQVATGERRPAQIVPDALCEESNSHDARRTGFHRGDSDPEDMSAPHRAAASQRDDSRETAAAGEPSEDLLTRRGLPPSSAGPPAISGGVGPVSERTAAALVCDSLLMPTVTGAVDQQALTAMTEEWLRAHGFAGCDDPGGGCGCQRHRASDPATRLRLRETLLHWAVEVLSGPGGLASYLRTGRYEGPLASPSIVLDVGRPTKTVPTHLEQAVRRRDRHCRWPGCDRPAELSQVHHIVPRASGGLTRIGNLLTLCDFHHLIAVHTWGWTVRLGGDGTTIATSPGGRVLREAEPKPTSPPTTGPPMSEPPRSPG